MAQGTVKAYDEQTRTGSIALEDGSEVTIDTDSTRGQDVRFLRQGQRVAFDVADGAARGLRLVTFRNATSS